MRCRAALCFVVGVVGPEQLGGVGAEQVVEAEPARDLLGEQVAAGQFGQRPPR
jgi:hypothetical protein